MDDRSAKEGNQQFHVSVKTDRDGFLRLSCPHCGLDFKVEADDAQLQHMLAEQVRRVAPDVVTESSGEDETTQLTCPYCSRRNHIVEMHTVETMRYFRQMIYRQVAAPKLNDFVKEIGRIWERRNRRSSGLISFKADTSRRMLPQRPLHGPDAPDMKILDLLCCGKRAKIFDCWYAVEHCPFCESSIRLS